MCRRACLFANLPSQHGQVCEMQAAQHSAQPNRRRTRTPIPKAGRHRLVTRRHMSEHIARQHGQFRQTPAALLAEDKGPVATQHLLGRKRQLLDRLAIRIQPPGVICRQSPVGAHHERLGITRIKDHEDLKRGRTRLGLLGDEVLKDKRAHPMTACLPAHDLVG